MVDCYPAFQNGLDEELRNLLGEYIPHDGDPSADEIIISIITDKYAGKNMSLDGLKMIEGWIMSKPAMVTILHTTEFLSSLSPSKRAQGLLSDIPYNGIDLLKLWVKSRDDRIEYLEAGLWPYYSDNEKALIIAPLLDHIESAKTDISDLVRLLRLEESSPLLREARAILAQMNLHFLDI